MIDEALPQTYFERASLSVGRKFELRLYIKKHLGDGPRFRALALRDIGGCQDAQVGGQPSVESCGLACPYNRLIVIAANIMRLAEEHQVKIRLCVGRR